MGGLPSSKLFYWIFPQRWLDKNLPWPSFKIQLNPVLLWAKRLKISAKLCEACSEDKTVDRNCPQDLEVTQLGLFGSCFHQFICFEEKHDSFTNRYFLSLKPLSWHSLGSSYVLAPSPWGAQPFSALSWADYTVILLCNLYSGAQPSKLQFPASPWETVIFQ